jgi:23S rRNA (cytidine1920-2'-O)/16S rRNA (cytidine1409-2'-O)-methyltransferase
MTTTKASRPSAKRRLDVLLVERGLVLSREQAHALILARDVLVDGVAATRPAAPVAADVAIELKTGAQYASRGGEKLAGAIERTSISIEGKRCLDVGASTGGFTDYLLQHGATQVVAVDVGYGQILPRLREDPRVDVRERTNARTMPPLDEPVRLVTIDVSFISLTMVLPTVIASLAPGGEVFALVKPQFEAGRDEVTKGGVVRDERVHASCIGRVALWAIDHGLRLRGVVRSTLIGPAGNREFFLWLQRPEEAAE